jgi:4'-phosphopantetheinyl transferase
LNLLSAASPPQRLDLFYRFWSRKEAYIKALGQGLSLPLPELDLALDTPQEWTLQDLTTEPGYAAAVAVHCPHATWQYYTLVDLL